MSNEIESKMTMKDLQQLQVQLIELRQRNYDLTEQVNKAKQRLNLTPTELVEAQKNDNLQLRQRINQAIQEREQLTDRLKLVKIEQFLKKPNIVESEQFPDSKSMPPKLAPIAEEVLKLIDSIRAQIIRRQTLDMQVTEFGKKTKTLGHVNNNIQDEITKLRETQKSLINDIEAQRQTVSKLEAIAASLHAKEKAIDSQQYTDYSPKKLDDLNEKIKEIDEEIALFQRDHQQVTEHYKELISAADREIEDSNTSKAIIERKLQQQIWGLQSEINKRRGVVVLSSKNGSSHDAQRLFVKSNELIQNIASEQQESWEMEERVAFSRNSVQLMAAEILKQKTGGVPMKPEQKQEAIQLIISIAELNRKKKILKRK